MQNVFAGAIAAAATAVMLLGACSDDDGPNTLAKGEDVDFIGSGGLGDQTMDITVEEEDGEVTGEVSFEPHGSVASLQCADTEADGGIHLGGQFTTVADDGDEVVGQWIAMVIREGEPDRASILFLDPGIESCDEALREVPADVPDSAFSEVEDGDDIETG